ncbi:MAG: AMP-binding protein [Salinivirgaceae bacterium]|nr:AMP-binding protein [Salinivirgaceae bacterium]
MAKHEIINNKNEINTDRVTKKGSIWERWHNEQNSNERDFARNLSSELDIDHEPKYNIELNGTKYNLKAINWFDLKNKNKAQWWHDIVIFLEQWANDSKTILLKTSGSTGKPKVLEAEKQKLWISATKTCNYFNLSNESTGLLCLSANYVAGKMMLVRAMVSGMNLICIEPSDNPVKKIKTTIDFIAMVPLQVQSSLKHKNFSNINQLIIGGGKVEFTLIESLKETKTIVYETFGMTETLSHIALKKLAPNYQEHFTPLNGVNIFQGFNKVMVINYPELGISNLKTNDIIELIDENGSFIWKGRTDFVINSGGIKISPEELEQKIAHLFETPFCIVGIPDTDFGEKVVLVIEGEPFETEKLFAEMKKSLSSYYLPKSVKFVDKIPLTDSGKIQRKKIFET